MRVHCWLKWPALSKIIPAAFIFYAPAMLIKIKTKLVNEITPKITMRVNVLERAIDFKSANSVSVPVANNANVLSSSFVLVSIIDKAPCFSLRFKHYLLLYSLIRNVFLVNYQYFN